MRGVESQVDGLRGQICAIRSGRVWRQYPGSACTRDGAQWAEQPGGYFVGGQAATAATPPG